MSRYPVLPLWVDAYLGDTPDLTLEQHGAYLLLLIYMWRSPDGAIPSDDATIARMLRVTTTRWRKRLRPVLMPYFIAAETPDRITSERLKKERKKWQQNRQQKKQAAQARWLKNNDSDNAAASLPHSSRISARNAYSSAIESIDRLPESSNVIRSNSMPRARAREELSPPKIGSKAKGNGLWSSEENRTQYALQKLEPYIDAPTAEERWAILLAAEDVQHERHEGAVQAVLRARARAQDAGERIGWVSPERRRQRPGDEDEIEW